MSSAESLPEILNEFAKRLRGHERLSAMNRDWQRRIAIVPTDDAPMCSLFVAGVDVSLADYHEDECDIILYAPSVVLKQIFAGELSPTEPYMSGDLRVQGSQEDMMRLDFVTLILWE